MERDDNVRQSVVRRCQGLYSLSVQWVLVGALSVPDCDTEVSATLGYFVQIDSRASIEDATDRD